MGTGPPSGSGRRRPDWGLVLGWGLIAFGAGNSLVGLALLLGGSTRGVAPALAGLVVGIVGFGQREGDPGLANRPQLRGLLIALFAAWLAAFLFLR